MSRYPPRKKPRDSPSRPTIRATPSQPARRAFPACLLMTFLSFVLLLTPASLVPLGGSAKSAPPPVVQDNPRLWLGSNRSHFMLWAREFLRLHTPEVACGSIQSDQAHQ